MTERRVCSAENGILVVGLPDEDSFFFREVRLLDFCRKQEETLRVGLGCKIGQSEGSGFAQLMRFAARLVQATPSGGGVHRRGLTPEGRKVEATRHIGQTGSRERATAMMR